MAETKTIVIQGVSFEAPVRYAEGHVLTTVEAKALNQTLHENLRNNFAKVVKDSNDKAEGSVAAEALPAKFAEYAEGYTFATPGTGGKARTMDPIEKEARSLARDILKTKLDAQGKKLTAPKEATDEQKAAYAEQIEGYIDQIATMPNVLAAAKKNVNARAKLVADTNAELGLGGGEAAAAE